MVYTYPWVYISGRWDSNPRPSRWQRDALPLSYARVAGDEIRTRDIQLGKLTLYQLSYSRVVAPNIGCQVTCKGYKEMPNFCNDS